MADQSSDPRNTWRWIRAIPNWLTSALIPVFRFTMFVTRKTWQKDLPVYAGLRLWIDGINADLYDARVKEALDLLETYAPVYLRWLRRTFQVIWVDQLLRMMKRGVRADYRIRILALNPWTVWHTPADRLALFLVVQAVKGRLRRALSAKHAGSVRESRRIFVETIECARRFPNSAALVAEWEDRFRLFREEEEESQKAATAQSRLNENPDH